MSGFDDYEFEIISAAKQSLLVPWKLLLSLTYHPDDLALKLPISATKKDLLSVIASAVEK